MQRLIVSANLTKEAWKVYRKLNCLKSFQFSKWVSQKLIKDFGQEKNLLIEQLNKLTEERNKIEEEIKEIAKKINKIKHE